jgi:hypothetical protein
MANQSNDSETPVREGNSTRNTSQLDSAGQAILDLLHRAADAAEDNSRKALERCQELLQKFQAAEDRIAELESEVQQSRERAERAEEWLNKISMEIKDRLINEPEERRRAAAIQRRLDLN